VVRLARTRNLLSGASLQGAVQSSLDRELSTIRARMDQLRIASQAKRTAAVATAGDLQDQATSLRQRIELQQALLQSSKRDLARFESLAPRGFVSARDLDARRDIFVARQQQLSSLQSDLTTLNAKIVEAGQVVAETAANSEAELRQFEGSIEGLQQRRVAAEADAGQDIVSPFRGRVASMNVKRGESVVPGAQLAAIVPIDANLVTELYLPSSAIGFVSRAQSVRIAVDAFPYDRFGALTGRIESVADTATTVTVPGGTSVAAYRVIVTFEPRSREEYAQFKRLRPDMTVQARIATSRQTILEWLFQPLVAAGW
jgi:membrane fusion protein